MVGVSPKAWKALKMTVYTMIERRLHRQRFGASLFLSNEEGDSKGSGVLLFQYC
jgi:hypothetical protein